MSINFFGYLLAKLVKQVLCKLDNIAITYDVKILYFQHIKLINVWTYGSANYPNLIITQCINEWNYPDVPHTDEQI